MELDSFKEQTQTAYFELKKTEVTLRILKGELSESADGNSFVIKWEMEGAAPSHVTGTDGQVYEFAGLPLGPWWYLPKSGRNQAGKPHGGWTRLTTMARKLGISFGGFNTTNITQDFVDKFVGKAFVASDFSGERKTKKQNGEPVTDETTGEAKTFVEYNFWQVKDSAARYNVAK